MQTQDIENKSKIDELTLQVHHLEQNLQKKDEEIYKLREDNKQMFTDLKGLATNEETYKYEIFENRSKKQELEQNLQELQEAQLSSELKAKNQSLELEKMRREFTLQTDQISMSEKQMEQMRQENLSLMDKLQKLEQDRVNL